MTQKTLPYLYIGPENHKYCVEHPRSDGMKFDTAPCRAHFRQLGTIMTVVHLLVPPDANLTIFGGIVLQVGKRMNTSKHLQCLRLQKKTVGSLLPTGF